jgi:SMODS and SLOG-associating 2TM effector domain 3/SMODS and SLOG-associating 2TM effector domain 1
MSSPYLSLTDEDLPSLFRQADALSIRMQRRFFRLLAAELIFLSLGAFAGIVSFPGGNSSSSPGSSPGAISLGVLPITLTYPTVLAALLILAALVFRLIRSTAHADIRWYEARAVAESAKSLAWRYAVGGRPFEISRENTVADTLLLHRLQETLTDVHGIAQRLAVTRQNAPDQITETMRALRMQSHDIRVETYRVGRIVDQQKWYERKQEQNRSLGRRIHWALAAFEAIGVIVITAQIFLPAFRGESVNVQAFVAALVTAGIAWAQAKRYQDLSISYHVAASEAATLEATVPEQAGEDAWAAFVDDAESAFSREHHLWRATRGV